MPVTIVNKQAKVKDVSKLDVTEIVLPEIVDAFGEQAVKLAKKKEKIAPLEKSVSASEKEILKAVDEVIDESVDITLLGEDYDLVIGPKGQRTEVTNTLRAAELLGEDLFLKLATVSITNLKKYLTPEQVAEVTKTEYKTKRRVKVEVK